MVRVTNCFKMIELLEKNGKMSTQDLAEQLQTNPRNIREYRKDLEEAGFTFQCYCGQKGGIELIGKRL